MSRPAPSDQQTSLTTASTLIYSRWIQLHNNTTAVQVKSSPGKFVLYNKTFPAADCLMAAPVHALCSSLSPHVRFTFRRQHKHSTMKSSQGAGSLASIAFHLHRFATCFATLWEMILNSPALPSHQVVQQQPAARRHRGYREIAPFIQTGPPLKGIVHFGEVLLKNI